MVALDGKALDYATNRIEAFALVQSGREFTEQMEAVSILLSSLGYDEEIKDSFETWLKEFIGPQYPGEIMLGLLVGLFMHQYLEESE